MSEKYSLKINWSPEDNSYIAVCPEFPGLLAHGDTWEDAAREARDAIEGIMEVMKEDGTDLPLPRLFNFKERYI